MWPAFTNSLQTNAPQSEIVHDRFRIGKHLSVTVDQVRRQEHKLPRSDEDSRLTGSKQLWLFNRVSLSDERWDEFEKLKDQTLKTSRAWAIRELFRDFWDYCYTAHADKFFKRWYGWSARSQRKPIVKVAKMLKRHLKIILTYFSHPNTNAMSKGFNICIHSIKSLARGFRVFHNYRTRILFYCGKLDRIPYDIAH